MPDETSAADELYYAIKSLPDWYGILEDAQDGYSSYQRPVGRLLSTLLLATDDAANLVAISGHVEANGGGGLIALLGSRELTLAVVRSSAADSFDFSVSVYPLSQVALKDVFTKHSYFSGVEEHSRHEGMKFDVEVAGETIAFAPVRSYRATRYTTPDAILQAFAVVRGAAANS